MPVKVQGNKRSTKLPVWASGKLFTDKFSVQ